MIHVITGPPCAGKSTYVREHAADGDVLVDYDVIAQALGQKEPHQAIVALSDPNIAAFVARRAVIGWALENAADVESWVVHTSPRPEEEAAYEAAGAEFVEMQTDMETCLARCAADGRPPGTEDAIREWFANRETAPKWAFFMPAKGGRMTIKTKTFEASADGNGSITGYAATFTREPDSYGDVIAKGAFAESIAAIEESGRPIPLLWNHDSGDLGAYIGTVTELAEDDHGLLFTASFDGTPEAQRARELASDGRLCKFSFAYDVLDQGTVTLEDGSEANELRKLNIHEVSLVMYPANRDTSVVEVKSAPAIVRNVDGTIAGAIEEATGLIVQDIEMKLSGDSLPEVAITAAMPPEAKACRRNSAKDEAQLRRISELCSSIQSVVDGLLEDGQPDEQEPEPEADEAKANAEEPDTANAEEPEAKEADVRALLQQASELLEKKEA